MVPDWLTHRAAVLPRTVALISDDCSLDYGELNRRVLGLAGALQAAGVVPGDRVAVLATNSVELVAAIHAVPRVGAVLVLLNCRLTPVELAWQLADADVRLLLCHAPTELLARAAAQAAGMGAPLVLPLPADEPRDVVDAHPLDAIHSIIYTSGTTGRPKGAMLTFGNFWASACGSAFNLGTQVGDRWLACMPLFHVGGLSIVLRSAIYGTAIVIQPGFDERAVAAALHDDAITHVSLVP
ncbi:MAG: AMP-binding protein, partial [Tepidiformaceae bacterium]